MEPDWPSPVFPESHGLFDRAPPTAPDRSDESGRTLSLSPPIDRSACVRESLVLSANRTLPVPADVLRTDRPAALTLSVRVSEAPHRWSQSKIDSRHPAAWRVCYVRGLGVRFHEPEPMPTHPAIGQMRAARS